MVLNLITISIIWLHTYREKELQQIEVNNRPSESVNLMKQALNLNEGQIKQIEKFRNTKLDQAKVIKDRLDDLKRQLADELFKSSPDTNLAKAKIKEIGELHPK